jgi:hypothetical protein
MGEEDGIGWEDGGSGASLRADIRIERNDDVCLRKAKLLDHIVQHLTR